MERTVDDVCWLLTGNEGYGVQETTLDFSSTMNDLGVQTPILSLTPGPITERLEALEHETHIVNVPPPQGLDGSKAGRILGFVGNRLRARRARGPLEEALEDLDPDAVLVQNRTLVPTAGHVTQRTGCQCVWRMADMGDQYPLDLNARYLNRLCRRFEVLPIGNSRHTSLSLSPSTVPPHVYLGVDPDDYDPEDTQPIPRETLGIPQESIVVGLVGRLHPTKGQRRLVEALHRLPEDVHALLVGGPLEGDYAEALRERARQLEMTDRVHLAGQVDDPRPYYATSDLVANARVDPEPFGRTIVEAMMMQTPVLAHAAGGPGETIVDGRTGWLVYSPTPEALAHGLGRALSDEHAWTHMGMRARRYALDRFRLENQVQQFLDIVNGFVNDAWHYDDA